MPARDAAAHRIVIVGGGFAGLNAARSLAHALPAADITLVDKRNFHLFQPLLYQVASGGLSPGDITAPLRSVLNRCRNVRTLLAEVTGFDCAARTVALHEGPPLAYDTLIVAAGAENHYFGNHHWAQFAPGLKTIEDATEIRRRILNAFEQAELEPDPARRRAWLRFIVVGAGPTGVELAGAIAEIARDTLRHDFRRIRPEESEILLLEGGPRVLGTFQPDLSAKAERALIRIGVRPRTGVRVTAIDAESVTVDPGAQRLEARTVIWAAGVRASSLGGILADAAGLAPGDRDRAGRLRVVPSLALPGHPEILVLGDLAWFEQDGQPLPGVSPVAMQQGWHTPKVVAAHLAGATPPPFRYWDKGTMATIGRASAVADLGFARYGGWFAWLTWLFVHLLYLVGYRNRLLVAIQWALQYATFNRGARLITGTGSQP
ncbi:MAG: NAD(P)/FAD-dependent oxidoreductase [Bryobacterales bacterium]|nr:NAD(P)/FAD-dependent oxidoreductase [Bryobacterales bacterium]